MYKMYKYAKNRHHGTNAGMSNLMAALPYHIVTSFDAMSASEGRRIIEKLGIKNSDWDFQIDAGGPVTDPFRIVYYFKHQGDGVMFWLKAKV